MKTIIATITLVAALTFGSLAAVNTASAQETSAGFSLTGDTNAEVENSFRELAESEGWREDWIQASIIYCRSQARIPCLTGRVEALRKLNAIVPAEVTTSAALGAPAVPTDRYPVIRPCSEVGANSIALLTCVNT